MIITPKFPTGSICRGIRADVQGAIVEIIEQEHRGGRWVQTFKTLDNSEAKWGHLPEWAIGAISRRGCDWSDCLELVSDAAFDCTKPFRTRAGWEIRDLTKGPDGYSCYVSHPTLGELNVHYDKNGRWMGKFTMAPMDLVNVQ